MNKLQDMPSEHEASGKHRAMVNLLNKSGTALVEEMTPVKAVLNHMVIGLCGEVGELADAIKRHTMYNKELDFENVVEELGDLEFYMEGLRQALELTRTETLEQNYDKLMKKRYPNGFSNEAAINRADKLETAAAVVESLIRAEEINFKKVPAPTVFSGLAAQPLNVAALIDLNQSIAVEPNPPRSTGYYWVHKSSGDLDLEVALWDSVLKHWLTCGNEVVLFAVHEVVAKVEEPK